MRTSSLMEAFARTDRTRKSPRAFLIFAAVTALPRPGLDFFETERTGLHGFRRTDREKTAAAVTADFPAGGFIFRLMRLVAERTIYFHQTAFPGFQNNVCCSLPRSGLSPSFSHAFGVATRPFGVRTRKPRWIRNGS